MLDICKQWRVTMGLFRHKKTQGWAAPGECFTGPKVSEVLIQQQLCAPQPVALCLLRSSAGGQRPRPRTRCPLRPAGSASSSRGPRAAGRRARGVRAEGDWWCVSGCRSHLTLSSHTRDTGWPVMWHHCWAGRSCGGPREHAVAG